MAYSDSESELAVVGDPSMGVDAATDDETDPGAVTGYTFTAKQVEYMKDKLDSYSNTPAKKRKRFLNSICNHFKDQITKREERPIDRNEENLLFEGIRTWFKTALKPARKSKNAYGTTWYPRLVYIKMHSKRIKALANRYVKGDFDIEKFLEEYDSDDPEANSSDNEASAGGKKGKKGKKGGPGDWFFNHFQDAASDLLKQLSQEELDRYERLAVKWTKEGPPKDIQAKNADKQAAKRGYAFSKDMNRDFNAITFSFIGWRREDGKPVAILSEFNQSLGRTVNFSVREKKAVESLFRSFRSYVYEEFEEHEVSEDENDLAGIRGQKQQLYTMVRNSYGEPFLPSLSARRKTPRCEWLRIVLRSFFIYHYQLSGNFKTADEFRFPWTRMLAEPRSFISEDMMPDDILELLKEPSDMRVGPMLAVYNYLYDKQEYARNNDDAVDDLTFELKAYVNEEDDIVERHPRVISMDSDGWGEYDDLKGDPNQEVGVGAAKSTSGVKNSKRRAEEIKGTKPSLQGKSMGKKNTSGGGGGDNEEEDGFLGDSEDDGKTTVKKREGVSKALKPKLQSGRTQRKREDSSEDEIDDGSWADSESESDFEGHPSQSDSDEESSRAESNQDSGEEGDDRSHSPHASDNESLEGGGGSRSEEDTSDADGDSENFDWGSWTDSEAESEKGSGEDDDSMDNEKGRNVHDEGVDEDEDLEVEEAERPKGRVNQPRESESENEEDNEDDDEEGKARNGEENNETEDEQEPEEKVSSFKGIRTRNQRARAREHGKSPPPSASQVGRVTRSRHAKRGQDEPQGKTNAVRQGRTKAANEKQGRRKRDNSDEGAKAGPSKGRRTGSPPARQLRKRGSDESEPAATPRKLRRTSRREGSVTVQGTPTRNPKSSAVPATPGRNRQTGKKETDRRTAQIRAPPAPATPRRRR